MTTKHRSVTKQVSYKAQKMCARLMEFSHHGNGQTPKEIGIDDGGQKMAEITWDSALAGSGKFVKLEEGKRVVLVGKNVRFERLGNLVKAHILTNKHYSLTFFQLHKLS